MPPTFSHSTDMVRMVDCTMRLATSLNPNMRGSLGQCGRLNSVPQAVRSIATREGDYAVGWRVVEQPEDGEVVSEGRPRAGDARVRNRRQVPFLGHAA